MLMIYQHHKLFTTDQIYELFQGITSSVTNNEQQVCMQYVLYLQSGYRNDKYNMFIKCSVTFAISTNGGSVYIRTRLLYFLIRNKH